MFPQVDGPAKFTLGADEEKGCSDDDGDDMDDEDDVVVEKTQVKLCHQISVDAFIPNVGILLSNTSINVEPEKGMQLPPNITEVSLNQVVQKDVSLRKHPLQHSCTEAQIDLSKFNSQLTPGIVIEKDKSKEDPVNIVESDSQEKHQLISNDSLDKSKKFSHSSGEVDSKDKKGRTMPGLTVEDDRRKSDRNLTLGISSSQSENAIKSIKSTAANVLTSPSAVLSPFSKLAKGVQSFGATLDPRKVVEKVGTKQPVSLEHVSEENANLQEKWSKSKCKSRLIAV